MYILYGFIVISFYIHNFIAIKCFDYIQANGKLLIHRNI